MNKELVCPFCQQELRKIHPTYVICDNCRITGEDKLWQELILTRKALDLAKEGLKEIQDKGEYVNPIELAESYLDEIEALEQITALEQKDIK